MENSITIRTAQEEDAEELLKIYEPYVRETAVTFEYKVPEVEEFTARIRKTLCRYPYLVAMQGEDIVGYTYASPFHERKAYDWAVEVSVYVKRDKRKLGIGRKLYQALESELKKMNIVNVNACIAYPASEDRYLTDDSVRFHERMGYQMVGRFHKCGYKFHRWYDMVWMEKHIGEHLENQPEVVAFCSVRHGR